MYVCLYVCLYMDTIYKQQFMLMYLSVYMYYYVLCMPGKQKPRRVFNLCTLIQAQALNQEQARSKCMLQLTAVAAAAAATTNVRGRFQSYCNYISLISIIVSCCPVI